KFNQAYSGGSAPLPSQVGTVDGYRSDAHTQQTLAYVGYAVGAAALGTGLWLWITDGKATGTTVVAGPGSVSLAGRFGRSAARRTKEDAGVAAQGCAAR